MKNWAPESIWIHKEQDPEGGDTWSENELSEEDGGINRGEFIEQKYIREDLFLALQDELASMTRMFQAACVDLGLINDALGLDSDDGGSEPILWAIEELKLSITHE